MRAAGVRQAAKSLLAKPDGRCAILVETRRRGIPLAAQGVQRQCPRPQARTIPGPAAAAPARNCRGGGPAVDSIARQPSSALVDDAFATGSHLHVPPLSAVPRYLVPFHP